MTDIQVYNPAVNIYFSMTLLLQRTTPLYKAVENR